MTTAVSETTQSAEASADVPNPFSRYIPLAVWLIVLITLAWIPFKILSYGYLPPDDALRHTAKAVTQRPWTEILVLRQDFQTDHNPGWHWLLGQVHRLTNAGTDGLLVTSVVGAFIVALVSPLLLLRRPEAWIGAVLLAVLTFPVFPFRILLGRPLALTMGVTMVILLLWRKREADRPAPAVLVATTLLLALSAWLHGSWYLFALVIGSYVLAERWRSAIWLTGCWLVGSFLGGCLTGHPTSFLVNAVRIGLNCFGGNTLQRLLAFEFWPSDGNVIALFTVASLLLWRRAAGRWSLACVKNPIFILAVVGWILGLRVSRFYHDWGAPALLVWVALELREHLERCLRTDSVSRLAVTGALAASLLFVMTADANGRWTNPIFVEFLSESDPEMKPWLPEDGGILYSTDMTVFYQTFFKNPQAKWRYMLGFEPTFMPQDDLKIYRDFQMSLGSYKSYEPWVKKMRSEDRLVVRSGAPGAPNIPGLDWHYTARELWIGRKPRVATPARPEAAALIYPTSSSDAVAW